MKEFYGRILYLYSRFQAFILTIFIAGFVELALYSDLLVASMALPEILPLAVLLILIYGLFRFVQSFIRKQKSAK